MIFCKKYQLRLSMLSIVLVLAAMPAGARQGASNGEWRYYGGDSGTTRYSPLDQINAGNVKNLRIAWQWYAENFGKRPESNWEVTPQMVDGVLYFTAGSRRDAVAVDAASGETLWMYRLDEGARGNQVARTNNRGLAYWSDGKGDNRILLISSGYQLVAIRQGSTFDDLIDFTRALKAEAEQIASRYKLRPLFSPPVVSGADGENALFLLPTHPCGHWPPNSNCGMFFDIYCLAFVS